MHEGIFEAAPVPTELGPEGGPPKATPGGPGALDALGTSSSSISFNQSVEENVVIYLKTNGRHHFYTPGLIHAELKGRHWLSLNISTRRRTSVPGEVAQPGAGDAGTVQRQRGWRQARALHSPAT